MPFSTSLSMSTVVKPLKTRSSETVSTVRAPTATAVSQLINIMSPAWLRPTATPNSNVEAVSSVQLSRIDGP